MFNPFSFLTDSTVNPEDVKRFLDAKESVLIVDVRTPEEYAQGHIQGSTLLPLQELPQKFSSLGNKERKIYLYCRSGARSAQAVAFLRQQGFTNAYTMSGGLLAWIGKHFPIDSSDLA